MKKAKTTEQRISEKIKVLENGCWEWTASLRAGIAPIVMDWNSGNRKSINVRRYLYELSVKNASCTNSTRWSTICGNRRCVNPLHQQVIEDRSIPPVERFWTKVEKTANCWIWTASITASGYGHMGMKIDGKHKQVLAHRFSYELVYGPIPEGTEIDHLCSNPICVNPDHLEAVTHSENMIRAFERRAHRSQSMLFRKTYCINGHEYTDENSAIYIDSGGKAHRQCRECYRIRGRERDRADREGTIYQGASNRTHCIRGHEFTDENLYYYEKNGYRQRMCKECRRVCSREFQRQRQEKVRLDRKSA